MFLKELANVEMGMLDTIDWPIANSSWTNEPAVET